MKEIIENVERWAEEKGILANSGWDDQLGKTAEEIDELYDAIDNMVTHEDELAGEVDLAVALEKEAKLEMGDVLVTLVIQCKMQGWDFAECLKMAYNKISKRTGKMVGGVFVKDGE